METERCVTPVCHSKGGKSCPKSIPTSRVLHSPPVASGLPLTLNTRQQLAALLNNVFLLRARTYTQGSRRTGLGAKGGGAGRNLARGGAEAMGC